MGRLLQALVDKTALAHNLQRVREIAPGRSIIAMVKANAYGHGLITVAEVFKDTDAFGVACIEEALELRQANIKKRIVLMEGFFSPVELKDIVFLQLEVVIHHAFQLQILEKFSKQKIKIWLKIDTGMHRLGFAVTELADVFNRLKSCQHLELQGIMTHFSNADEIDNPKTNQQIATFMQMGVQFPKPSLCSLANSAAILAWPEAHGDWVRPGLMLYGVSPFKDAFGSAFNLKPVMTLVTELIAIQTVKQGETVGYGSRFVCPEDMLVGVIAIGYGDGYSSLVPDGTPVLINGRRASIAGRVSMDMATIDLRGHEDVKIGDKVVLWGQGLPVEEIAKKVDVLPYELLTLLGPRVARVYENNVELQELVT